MTGIRQYCVPAGRMVLTLALFSSTALMTRAQEPGITSPYETPQMIQRLTDKTAVVDKPDMTDGIHRTRMLNVARQKALVSDADKLLALARQLNAGVTAEGVPLNAAQRIKMAADIEKLAHSVKERMTYTVGGELAPANFSRGWQ